MRDDIDDIDPTDAYAVLRDHVADVGLVLPEDPGDLPRGSHVWGRACAAAESLPHGSALVRAAWGALGELPERTWAQAVEIGYDIDAGGYTLDEGPRGADGYVWFVDDSGAFSPYLDDLPIYRALDRGGMVLVGYTCPAYGGGARPDALPAVYRGAVRVGAPIWLAETDHDCVDCVDFGEEEDEDVLTPEGGHVACHRCGGAGSVVSPALVAVAYLSAADAPIEAVRAAVRAAGYTVADVAEGSEGWALRDSDGETIGDDFTSEIDALLWAIELEDPT